MLRQNRRNPKRLVSATQRSLRSRLPNYSNVHILYKKSDSTSLLKKLSWSSRHNITTKIKEGLKIKNEQKIPRTQRGYANLSKKSYYRSFILHGENRRYRRVLKLAFRERDTPFVNINFYAENESRLDRYNKLKTLLGHRRYTKKRLRELKENANSLLDKYVLGVFLKRRIYDLRLLNGVYLKPLLLGEVFITHKKRNIFVTLFSHTEDGKQMLFKTSAV